MGITTLWPDSLLSQSFAPIEPGGGLRGVRVRLAQWWSPVGFPWDVSVALLRWGAGSQTGAGGVTAANAALLMPCLILTPRPWLRPSREALADLDAWVRSHARLPSPFGADPNPTWEMLQTAPSRVSALRSETLEARTQIARYLASRKASDHGGLGAVGLEAPWQFLLSVPLQCRLATMLGLDGPLLPEEILIAAHQWAAMTDTAQIVPPKDARDLGLFELLARRLGPRRAGAQELANYLTGIDGGSAHGANPKVHGVRRKNWRCRLRELGVNTTLLPLPRVPLEPGLAQLDPAEGAWALEWLAADRTPHLLRLVFGHQVGRLTWCSGPDQVAVGLGPFSDSGWTRHLVVDPSDVTDCARVEWRLGATTPEAASLDVVEFFRLVVAPMEVGAHAAERELASVAAARVTSPDVVACDDDVVEDGGGDLARRAGPGSAITDPLMAAAVPAHDPRAWQTGKDLKVYRQILGIYAGAAARVLGVTEQELLHAEATPLAPLPRVLHDALLKEKAREDEARAKAGLPPYDWNSAIRPDAKAREPRALDGSDLERWIRAHKLTQIAAAKRLGVGQSAISKALSHPERALTPKLQNALTAAKSRAPRRG